MKPLSHSMLRLLWSTLFAWGIGAQVSAKVDMRFWEKPGYFDEYYQDLMAQGAKLPTVKTEEQEILKIYHDFTSKQQDARGLAYLQTTITQDASAALDFTLGLHYYRIDQLDDALKFFNRAVHKWPTFQAAHKLIGYCHLQKDEWDKSAAAFARSTQLAADDARTFGLLGMIYLNQEKILESESAYKKAIVADPDTMDWFKGLASTLLNQEKHLESISLFEEMIARADETKDQSDFLILQANSFIALDQPLAAAANYEIVRRMGQATFETMSRLGDIYLNEDQLELATEAHVEAIEMDPSQDQDRPVRTAEIIVARGFWDHGETVIKAIRRVFEESLSDEHHLSLLRLEARIAIALERGAATAIKLLEEILEIDPEDKETVLLLARYHYSQSRKAKSAEDDEGALKSFDEARKYFEQATELGDDEFKRQVLIDYAQILVDDALYCDAIEMLKDALDVEYTIRVENYLERVESACRRQRLSTR